MRYLPPRSGALIEWLEAELPAAVEVTAACRAVDAAGLSLLAGPVGEFLDRGGRLRVLVATPSADGLHRAYLGGTTWTEASLLGSCPAVLFELRRDSAAAGALLGDVTGPGHVAVPEPAVAVLKDLFQPAMTSLQGVSDTRSLRTGVVTPGRRGAPTGLADLDALTGGVWPGDLWVITGRTGAGKSVLALDLARASAVGQRTPSVLLLGRDDPRDAVARLLSAEARVPLHHLRLGTLTDDDSARLARRMGEIWESPLHVAREGTEARPAAPDELVAASAHVVLMHDVQMLVVDDLTVTATGDHLPALKELAVRERIAVVVVLGDGPDRTADEAEASRRADVVIRIDRDHDMDCDGQQPPRAGEADLAILRHRRGPIGVVTVAFQGHYARFVDMTTA